MRRVVTGVDGGRSVFRSDGVPPRTVGTASGPAVSELLWLDAMPTGLDDGGDPAPARLGAFPDGGAIAARLIRLPGSAPGTPEEQTWLRMPGDDARPGMHRSETLDLMVIVEGDIVLGLDDGEYPLGPGDAVVQRGTAHRWRVAGEAPCTYLSVLISPDPQAPAAKPLVRPESAPVLPGEPRRVVTGTAPDGTSVALAIGPMRAAGASGVALDDLWQTGGPVADVGQGGGAAGGWELAPAAHGIAFRRVEFAPGCGPEVARLHATDTIDVGVVLSGALELGVGVDAEAGDRGLASRRIGAGEVYVQGGAMHRWLPVGADRVVMVTVMISLQPAPTDR